MKIENVARALLQLLAPRRGGSRTAPERGRSTATLTGARPSSGTRPAGGSRPADPATATAGIAEYDTHRWGAPTFAYHPDPDGDADPGEIVWGWVPYEEDASQGKDRPVLIVGTRGKDLVGVQLTSKDHSRDAARETARGRTWVDIGSGSWDSRGRESEARADRLLIVGRAAVRREGATLARARYDDVVAAVRRQHGW
ncbi:growth inhibitor PemK [Serinibacter arcticus]|uniref:Growth inhibitor PemK n=1 Tax=Serinibacter arcticus TaxID=1655435 RepID=A0A2U1ZZ45_9MICO|nr:type II toxin-antitoxin system PemK/MazF family toxin [Serinibacter arcticus]PWD52257.1 growth inhibitor PemK [Serinibacter arcticus]